MELFTYQHCSISFTLLQKNALLSGGVNDEKSGVHADSRRVELDKKKNGCGQCKACSSIMLNAVTLTTEDSGSNGFNILFMLVFLLLMDTL